MKCDSRLNPLTREREPGARFCRDAIVFRLTHDEALAVEFALDRGYIPNSGALVWREHGGASWRFRREDAYTWAEQVESDVDAFCACLDRRLTNLFHAADFRIRDSWAV